MKPVALIVLVFVGSVISQCDATLADQDDLDVGYYWREYDKDIPEDALPGGRDKRGKKTYIGQTLHGNNCNSDEVVVTGHLYEAEQIMKYEWGYRKQIAENPIQVLCTRHPGQFEWIETNVRDIYNLTDKHLVSGGREKNYTVYVGRMKKNDEIVVGKVIVSDLHYMEGFYTIVNDTKLHVNKDYEVLAYNDNHVSSFLRSTGSTTIYTTKKPLLISGLLMLFSTAVLA